MKEYIEKEVAIKALSAALYDYEDKTEKQFLDNYELDICSWFEHRIFVQNMNGIDRQTILNMNPEDVRENTRGKWTEFCECSVCGFSSDDFGRAQILRCDFCPSCGAYMR